MTARSDNALSIGATPETQDLASEQQGLLDLIEKLQFAQLDNVKLPQIVVVGDQSAGKSSVLEALTGTPFPREAGACTRFATEIRLRRSDIEKFSVHIIPDKRTRSFAEQERLLRFGGKVDESMSFHTLMRLAVDQIAPKNIPGRFAAGDILVVEKQGPNMPLLTVVDLPGLVRNPNNDQSIADIKAINDLTDHYMKSSRTIILAVVGGNQDYVQAPVLTKARDFDPTGGRTIGVLTKPDLTESIGLEDKFIALVNNKDRHNHFDLGWYVLLNPGPREPGQDWPTAEQRRSAEDRFFTTGKWGTLPNEMCGVMALRQKLSAQLQRHIGKHVKTLQKEIQKAHNDIEAELKLMGTGKDTVSEMKEELVELCSNSKDLVTPAVHGTYTNPIGKSFFPRSVDRKGTPPQKLRARAVEENRRFADRVRTNGQKFQFRGISDPQGGQSKGVEYTTRQEFAREVKELLRQNTGTEFPLDHNPRQIYTLFQSHAQNWAKLAQQHKDNLGLICNQFLGEVIDHVWPHRMREPLRREFLDPQMRTILEKAQKEVDLLRHDLDFEIQPYDPEYERRLTSWRAEASKEKPYTEEEEILEKMLIYYELSAKTFISNVITQVIERHLLQGLHTIFNWVTINRMKDETVMAIAAENKVTRDKRMTLRSKLVAIEEARDICANLAMRKELSMYGQDDSDDDSDSSDDEESSPSTRNNRQHSNPNTPRGLDSSNNSPPRSQWTSSHADQAPTAPPMLNGNARTAPDNSLGQDYRTPNGVTNTTSDAGAHRPSTPNGWETHSRTDFYSPTSEAPQYSAPPPPPPPRPFKSHLGEEDRQQQYAQPSPDGRQNHAVPERNPAPYGNNSLSAATKLLRKSINTRG